MGLFDLFGKTGNKRADPKVQAIKKLGRAKGVQSGFDCL